MIRDIIKKLLLSAFVVGFGHLAASAVDAEIIRNDTSFDTDGIKTQLPTGSYTTVVSIGGEVLEDGRYLVAGYGYSTDDVNDIFVWRYLPDGTLDSSFGIAGVTTFSAGGGWDEVAYNFTVDSNGKSIVVGSTSSASTGSDILIVRFNMNGSLDTTFSSDGYFTQNGAAGGDFDDTAYSIRPLADGKYIIGGASADVDEVYHATLWRLNSDGSLDTTFNTNGYVVYSGAPGASSEIYAVGVDNGKYVVSGFAHDGVFSTSATVWRFNADGSLDPSFSDDGLFTYIPDVLSNISLLRDLCVDPSGNYLLSGYIINDSGLHFDHLTIRLNSTGTLDSDFGIAGAIEYDGGIESDFLFGNSCLSNGKYIIAGAVENSDGNQDLIAMALDEDGSLNTAYDGDGILSLGSISDGDERFASASFGENGRILLTGDIANDSLTGSNSLIVVLENLYQIDMGVTGLGVEIAGESIELGDDEGGAGSELVTIMQGGAPIAEVSTFLTDDVVWGSIAADIDPASGSSYLHGIASVSGFDGSYSLYIPQTALDNSWLLICPGASSLGVVSYGCPSMVIYDVDDSDVSEVIIGPDSYYKIAGLTSTGGRIYTPYTISVVPNRTVAALDEFLSITVTIRNSAGAVDGSYRGTIHFTSSSPSALLPADYTFTVGDAGTHTFNSEFLPNMVGVSTITATDTFINEFTGSSAPIQVLGDIEDDGGSAGGGTTGTVPDADDLADGGDDGSDEEASDGTDDDTDEELPNDNETDSGESVDDNGSDGDPADSRNLISKILDWIGNRVQSIAEGESNTGRVLNGINLISISTVIISLFGVSLFELPNMLIRWFLSLLALLGVRRKGLPYGLVYDAVSKEPVPNAIVRVLDQQGRLVATEVTDAFGVFSVFLAPGQYRIEVGRGGYNFPSKVIRSFADYPLDNVYHGGEIEVSANAEHLYYSIPLDPQGGAGILGAVLRERLALLFRFLQWLLLFGGFMLSIYLLVLSPAILNLLTLLFYLLSIGLLLYKYYFRPDPYGYLYLFNGAAASDVAIGLYDVKKESMVAKRVTDNSGRYRFVVPKGEYALKVLSDQYIFAKRTEFVKVAQTKLMGGRSLVRDKIAVEKVTAGTSTTRPKTA